MSGQEAVRASISAVSKSDPCTITTASSHGLSTGNWVRITDLGPVGRKATDRGMDQLDGKEFIVYVTTTTDFYIRDPITMQYIDSTNYVTYVSGGQVTLEQQEFIYEGDS